MVVPILNKEYDKFNKLSTNIQSATTRSDHDINVKWLESHHARAQTRLFMHISLVICVCMAFYYNQTPKTAVAIAIIASTVVLTVYNVEISRRVRTRHRHNYWMQPKKYRETISS
jgi:Ca2+/H+ antiporter